MRKIDRYWWYWKYQQPKHGWTAEASLYVDLWPTIFTLAPQQDLEKGLEVAAFFWGQIMGIAEPRRIGTTYGG